jgi:hypothetical protein
MTQQWEYKIVHILADRWTGTGLPEDINIQFDQFGSEGWELVSTESLMRPGIVSPLKTVAIVAFFKRPLTKQS